jgi:short subunit dehydrogenase-like uncharacterized protein
MSRTYDIVIYGATGFVGRLSAEYLAEHAPAGLSVALAGRSLQRLEDVRSSLPAPGNAWPLVAVDSDDLEGLRALARSTTVLVTTVGPYRKYGMKVAQACAESGTDYLDLTGEVLFVRDCIDNFDAVAKASGARIVNACGFDSIPSDLGAFLLHQAAEKESAGTLEKTTLLVTSMRGGFSGGTIDSLRTQLAEVTTDKARRKVAGDPYALSPDRKAEIDADGYDRPGARFDKQWGMWTSPFIMAAFNTRIVRRSNALLGHAYGRGFSYTEVSAAGTGRKGQWRAKQATFIIGLFFTAMQKPALRRILDRFLPKPGSGPSDEQMRKGKFRMSVLTQTSSGRALKVKIGLDLDPGYRGTALMLMESALCLLETPRSRTGVLTPATAMGMRLVDQLRKAGMRLEVD